MSGEEAPAAAGGGGGGLLEKPERPIFKAPAPRTSLLGALPSRANEGASVHACRACKAWAAWLDRVLLSVLLVLAFRHRP